MIPDPMQPIAGANLLVYHRCEMRRLLSIALVLFFGLGPLSALAGASDDDASLPACCRRNGAHHCAMTAMLERMERSSGPAFSAPATCPSYPGAAVVLAAPVQALAAAAASMPAMTAQAHKASVSRATLSSRPNRAHAGRGPPSLS